MTSRASRGPFRPKTFYDSMVLCLPGHILHPFSGFQEDLPWEVALNIPKHSTLVRPLVYSTTGNQGFLVSGGDTPRKLRDFES